jgi:hypothetical protein
MKEKYGENWGLGTVGAKEPSFKTGQAPTWERIAEQYHGDPKAMQPRSAIQDTRWVRQHPWSLTIRTARGPGSPG